MGILSLIGFFKGDLGKVLLVILFLGGLCGTSYYKGYQRAVFIETAKYDKQMKDYIEQARKQAELDRKAQEKADAENRKHAAIESDLKKQIAELAKGKNTPVEQQIIKDLNDIFSEGNK
jgi:hypothetical protein